VNIVLGQQKGFSWAAVAGAAVTAGVTQAINAGLSGTPGEPGYTAQPTPINAAVAALAGGLAGGVVRAVLSGGRINFAQIAADAFGNALGTFIGMSIAQNIGQQPGVLRQAQADATPAPAAASIEQPMALGALAFADDEPPLVRFAYADDEPSGPLVHLAQANTGTMNDAAPIGAPVYGRPEDYGLEPGSVITSWELGPNGPRPSTYSRPGSPMVIIIYGTQGVPIPGPEVTPAPTPEPDSVPAPGPGVAGPGPAAAGPAAGNAVPDPVATPDWLWQMSVPQVVGGTPTATGAPSGIPVAGVPSPATTGAPVFPSGMALPGNLALAGFGGSQFERPSGVEVVGSLGLSTWDAFQRLAYSNRSAAISQNALAFIDGPARTAIRKPPRPGRGGPPVRPGQGEGGC
jgi:hypothetical protein